jgi:hypothetical protein
LGFESIEPPLAEGEGPGEEGLPGGEGLWFWSGEVDALGETDAFGLADGDVPAVTLPVVLGLGVTDAVVVVLVVVLKTAWTMKYPAATIPVKTTASRIKSQTLLPPPPPPFITASGCPHSGQIGAPSKRIWSPV